MVLIIISSGIKQSLFIYINQNVNQKNFKILIVFLFSTFLYSSSSGQSQNLDDYGLSTKHSSRYYVADTMFHKIMSIDEYSTFFEFMDDTTILVVVDLEEINSAEDKLSKKEKLSERTLKEARKLVEKYGNKMNYTKDVYFIFHVKTPIIIEQEFLKLNLSDKASFTKIVDQGMRMLWVLHEKSKRN